MKGNRSVNLRQDGNSAWADGELGLQIRSYMLLGEDISER
jgi:hypothetical protein